MLRPIFLRSTTQMGRGTRFRSRNVPLLRFHSSATVSSNADSGDEKESLDTTKVNSLRRRAQEDMENFRGRAQTMRTNMGDSFRNARENPREAAKSFGGMIKMYGPVFVGTYLGVYFSTLFALYAGVESGVLDPVSLFGFIGLNDASEAKNTVQLVVDFMNDHAMTRPYASYIEKHPSVANLGVAWIAVKFTEPPRLATSLALTPRVARALGYKPKKV